MLNLGVDLVRLCRFNNVNSLLKYANKVQIRLEFLGGFVVNGVPSFMKPFIKSKETGFVQPPLLVFSNAPLSSWSLTLFRIKSSPHYA